ncbi:hypothetical protein MSG28_001498 [Choristoneura fumiferana]|uniref:Uncharacterized protein n=1 Tax=Choristoneura fumiferana TaxID=7141 RepID=A0ACC0KUW1_CHOFU|nr:hypothetical protein MSG28_001498 [Choristoneura fumiferana]
MDLPGYIHYQSWRWVPKPAIEVTQKKLPSPPKEPETSKVIPTIIRTRNISESQAVAYAEQETDELLAMLRETESLDEQGDILQYLVDTHGLEFNTVRHTAGMLGKRVEDLAKAVTDLLVRQKQITVGMPPNNEHTITAPLPENELRQLIHLVMATELSRTLSCDGEEASEHLLNLSPFEMKNLLYHILSGKEFAINSVAPIAEPDRQGQWLRRRRLDGALNRCQGLVIQGKVLQPNLTQEMTSGELKFALAVETVLNSIPQPEYRQLVVEALMVLTLVVEYKAVNNLGGTITVEYLMRCNGDATLCCAKAEGGGGALVCGGAAGVCQHLYDSAPSGSYGTMTYLARSVAALLADRMPPDAPIECAIT